MRTPTHLQRLSQARGQTLVLFAMSLLLLTLMVCMTLSFSSKVREKIETQTLADSAAFSNSVATARAYNVVSIMNRTQVSHMVAQAAALSLVSWGTIFRAGIGALWLIDTVMLAVTASDCSGWNICACITLIPLAIDLIRLTIEYWAIFGLWNAIDTTAALQANERNDISMLMWADEILWYNTNLANQLNGQTMAKNNIVPGTSSIYNDLSAPGAADAVTRRETDMGGLAGCLGGVQGAACYWNLMNEHAVSAGMGSRGWAFITGRWDLIYGNPMKTALQNFVTGTVNLFPDNEWLPMVPWGGGSGHWGSLPLWDMLPFLPNAHGMLPLPSGIYGYGEDHYLLEYDGPMCADPSPFPCPLLSMVRGSFGFTGDHEWYPDPFPYMWFPPPPDAEDPGAPAKHTLSTFPNPGVWPEFIDYNWHKVSNQQDNFGQPKNIAVIQRDYGAGGHASLSGSGPDPWNLMFNFKLVNAGPGENFDNRGMQLNDPQYTNIDISKQVAMGAGIAYYHRGPGDGHHWKEPPNFLNPYWRATLVSPDTDKQGSPSAPGNYDWCAGGGCAGGGEDPAFLLRQMGSTNICTTGSSSTSCWEDTYHQLVAKGFKGFQ